jgi:hypothetical protein
MTHFTGPQNTAFSQCVLPYTKSNQNYLFQPYCFIALAKGVNLFDTPSPLLPTDYIE